MPLKVVKYVANDEGKYDTVVTTEYVGQVVDSGSTYMGDGDSSYFVIVFDYESGDFTNVYTGYTPGDYTIDGSPAMLKAYAAGKVAKAAVALAAVQRRSIQQAYDEAVAEAANPSRGKTVVVVKGRKIPIGTIGVVKVNCEGQWGRRILLTLPDASEVWISEGNVDVVQAPAELVGA